MEMQSRSNSAIEMWVIGVEAIEWCIVQLHMLSHPATRNLALSSRLHLEFCWGLLYVRGSQLLVTAILPQSNDVVISMVSLPQRRTSEEKLEVRGSGIRL